MALNPSTSSTLKQLPLKGLVGLHCQADKFSKIAINAAGMTKLKATASWRHDVIAAEKGPPTHALLSFSESHTFDHVPLCGNAFICIT